jgi:hypothetical protein
MTVFLTEQPIVSEEGPRRELAGQVAEWICTQPIVPAQNSPAPRGYVAGIYGSRGGGKTSFLFTLLAELRAKSQRDETSERSGGSPPACTLVLPRADSGYLRSPIFKPSETRVHDGLLLMLLKHFEDLYPPDPRYPEHPENREHLIRSIQRADVVAKETKLFLDYEKEISPSVERLKDLYVATLTDAATTTLTIRQHFYELLQLRIPHDGRLTLLIDDVDLQPHRALELLEVLHLFLDHPNVFIVMAADKPLLLHAIDQEILRKRTHQSGLAAALLAKYVPYSWTLPVPTHQEVRDSLRQGLYPWWSRGGLSVSSQPVEYVAQNNEERKPIIDAAAALERVRPRTYREINALVNTLRTWKLRLVPNVRADSTDESAHIAFHDAVQSRYNNRGGLGLLRSLAPPFLVLLAAVDIRWPDLGLLEALEFEPALLLRALSPGFLTDPAVSSPPLLDLPILTALRDDHRFSPTRRGQARQALLHVAEVLESWRGVNATAGSAERFLFVTLYGNAHAPTTFRRLWESQLTEQDANSSHLDLRGYAEAGRPNGSQVHGAKEHAKPLLASLVGSEGRLWLCAEAPLSFLAWLGSAIDYRRPVVAWNARDLRELDVPQRLLPPDRGGIYKVTECIWANEDGTSHANVIFDFLGRSGAHDLDVFPHQSAGDADGVNPVLGCRLVYQGSSNFYFADIANILLDVLELLSELRARRVTTVQAGLIMPDVVAFALGRQLRSRGLTIELHERVGARYERSITLEE